MKKAIKGIVILLCATFLMSHNVSAADINETTVQYYRTLAYNLRYSCYGASGDTYSWHQAGSTCHMGANREISVRMKTVNEPTLATGEYFFEIFLEVSGSTNFGTPIWFGAQTGYPMTFVSEEQVSSTTRGDLTTRVYRLLYHWQGGVDLNSSANEFNISAPGGVFNSEAYRVNSVVLWKVFSGGSGSFSDVVSAINNQSTILRSIDTNIIYGVQHLDNIEDYLEGLGNIGSDVGDIKDTIEDRQQQEDEALDNISDQTPEDISESGETENQASTNLIGVFSSFISALSGITAANNCNITLSFPSFAGGSQTVNVCQNRDKGGNLVAIFSSLTLIVFYIPLALKLLSMIYNEIRSFTNG